MAKTSATRSTGLQAGFGKREITPPLPFPLAGMADKHERPADRVRDPLCARALAFADGERTALVISADLLLITAHLRETVEQRLAAHGVGIDGLMLSATHTHSSFGGYWDVPSARLFLGAYRPELFELLATRITEAALDAVGDLQPAKLSFGDVQTQYLNYNRRHKEGAIDRTLGLLRIERPRGGIRVAFFGAHPVVTAFRQYNLASADYPGEIVRRLEASGDHGMFVVGPVGGVNVLYPEGPLDADVHLELLGRLLWEQIERAEAAATPVAGDTVGFAVDEVTLRVTTPRLFPDRLAWLDGAAYPLRLWVRRFGRRGMADGRPTRVPVVRVGDLVFAGYPADLGASVSLATRQLIGERGWRTAVVASQTDDYVGYVHLPSEYHQFDTADKAALWMILYENAMGFGGRQMGEMLLAACGRALARI
jgi:hypothetical protein